MDFVIFPSDVSLFLLIVWYDVGFGTDMGLGDMESK